MPAKARKGDRVVTTVAIENRDAFPSKKGIPGKTKISLPAGTRLKAATDEIGGNIFAQTQTDDGTKVVVGLAEGEWKLDR